MGIGKQVDDVRAFWEANPLWTGESRYEPGSKDFFEEHRRVIIADGFAGKLDTRVFPSESHRRRVLDLGCGPGFWVVELARAGAGEIVGADLTNNAIRLARQRCDTYGVAAELCVQNAERMTFPDASFSHVNCIGVIHHTPDTLACVREIARVIEPGGTATIAVYYRNIILQAWPYLRWLGRALHARGAALRGRGREAIFANPDVDEIVRLYDGAQNPIGKAYTKRAFVKMLEPFFEIRETFLHFFPARSLPSRIPQAMHRWLDRNLGFLIYATLVKK